MESILVVEDEDNVRETLALNLEAEGYAVRQAKDGEAGLSMARENPPDVVILDWMLPGMDGLEVCRRLRAGRRRRPAGIPGP